MELSGNTNPLRPHVILRCPKCRMQVDSNVSDRLSLTVEVVRALVKFGTEHETCVDLD